MKKVFKKKKIYIQCNSGEDHISDEINKAAENEYNCIENVYRPLYGAKEPRDKPNNNKNNNYNKRLLRVILLILITTTIIHC